MHIFCCNDPLHPPMEVRVSPMPWPSSLHVCVWGHDSDMRVNIITAMIMKQQFPPRTPCCSQVNAVFTDRNVMMCEGMRPHLCNVRARVCVCSGFGYVLRVCVCVCVCVCVWECEDSWAAVFGQLTVECDRWRLYPTIIERWERRTNVCLSVWFTGGGRVAFKLSRARTHTHFISAGVCSGAPVHAPAYMCILVLLLKKRGA